MTPVSTPFGFTSTASEVLAGVDLAGRRAIVTGATSGIGVETARALAAAGATVMVEHSLPSPGVRETYTAAWLFSHVDGHLCSGAISRMAAIIGPSGREERIDIPGCDARGVVGEQHGCSTKRRSGAGERVRVLFSHCVFC